MVVMVMVGGGGAVRMQALHAAIAAHDARTLFAVGRSRFTDVVVATVPILILFLDASGRKQAGSSRKTGSCSFVLHRDHSVGHVDTVHAQPRRRITTPRTSGTSGTSGNGRPAFGTRSRMDGRSTVLRRSRRRSRR